MRLTLKPLAYVRRNGRGDKGEVGGHLRKCGGEDEQANAEVLNERRGVIAFGAFQDDQQKHTHMQATPHTQKQHDSYKLFIKYSTNLRAKKLRLTTADLIKGNISYTLCVCVCV